jgi:formylglycine-generating enzyme required for sulfatase activity
MENAAPDGRGGGAQCIRSTARFTNCLFTGNIALQGGALSVEGLLADGHLVQVIDCDFIENGASTFAAAINAMGPMTMSGSTVSLNEANAALETGALHVFTGDPVTVGDSFFCRNIPGNIVGPFIDGGGLVLSQDCDADGVCDIEELAAGDERDCDGNGLPDSCDIADGAPDCNENGVPDACDLASGFSQDIDANGVPDDCKADCDADGLPDAYELANGLDSDCDANGTIDWCDLAAGAFDDDGDGRLDVCEYARGDFNLDGFVNGADLAPLLSLWGLSDPPIGDLNGDGLIGGADLSILLGNWGAIAWPPVLSRIAPREGPAYGGTVIVIEGAGLGGATAVRFGGAEAGAITTLDSARISVVAPAHAEGLVAIEVVTAAGAVTVPAMFRYMPASLATPAWATLVEAVPGPAIVYDAELRAAIIATGWAWKVRDNGTGIEMLLIPPGTYDMGCSASPECACGIDESPVHPVSITQPFYIGRTEVTQAEWSAVTGSNDSYFWFEQDSPTRPVEQVNIAGVQWFVDLTGLRLPTEAEWEYAYRAGSETAFHGWSGAPSGVNDPALISEIAWSSPSGFCDGVSFCETHVVGTKQPNGWGLYDMAGNVREMVSDWYSANYYTVSPLSDPPGPESGDYRVVRGGDAFWGHCSVGASRRSYIQQDTGFFYIGFRVARDPN